MKKIMKFTRKGSPLFVALVVGVRSFGLKLFANSAQTPLAVTSRYGWAYGGYPFNNNPSDSRPHHFYDEVHRLTSQMTAGSKVRVQVDAGNNAPSYTIDLMDFEQVAPAASQPSGSF